MFNTPLVSPSHTVYDPDPTQLDRLYVENL